MDCLASLLNLWSHLRASHHVYWTLHWQSRGPNFYGDHELFERLYGERTSEIDSLAEMIASHYGADKLDPLVAWKAAQSVIEAMLTAASPVAIAHMTVAAAEAADAACVEAAAPAGTRNLVSGISTSNLSALYLLQQRFGRLSQ